MAEYRIKDYKPGTLCEFYNPSTHKLAFGLVECFLTTQCLLGVVLQMIVEEIVLYAQHRGYHGLSSEQRELHNSCLERSADKAFGKDGGLFFEQYEPSHSDFTTKHSKLLLLENTKFLDFFASELKSHFNWKTQEFAREQAQFYFKILLEEAAAIAGTNPKYLPKFLSILRSLRVFKGIISGLENSGSESQAQLVWLPYLRDPNGEVFECSKFIKPILRK